MNIIIIGATSGIGKELWKLYAKEDNHVIFFHKLE
jgi:short-subunit dehydrogenase